MTDYVNINDLSHPRTVVVDLETGTVVGKDLKLVYVPGNVWEEFQENEIFATEFAERYGSDLYINLEG